MAFESVEPAHLCRLRQDRPEDRPRRVFAHLDEVCTLDDPRSRGKALTANMAGFWRYRVGDYRVIVEIQDAQLVIVAVAMGHRSVVYGD